MIMRSARRFRLVINIRKGDEMDSNIPTKVAECFYREATYDYSPEDVKKLAGYISMAIILTQIDVKAEEGNGEWYKQ